MSRARDLSDFSVQESRLSNVDSDYIEPLLTPIHISSSSVGIGISSPSDDVELTPSADGKGITLKTTDNVRPYLNFDANRSGAGNNLAQINFKWNGTEVARIIGVAGADTTNKDDAHIAFQTASAGSPSEVMRINSSGNIGVGTSSPLHKLHLHGTNPSIFVQGDGNSYYPHIKLSGLHGGLHFGTYHGGNVTSENNYSIWTGSTSGDGGTRRLTILNSNGNVGIGTPSPRMPLTIAGDNSTSVGIGIDNASGTSTLDFVCLGSGYNAHGAGPGEIWLYSPDNINIGGATGNSNVIKFLGGGSERMRLDASGRLLIGATTYDANNKGVFLNGASGKGFFTVTGDAPLAIHRLSSDGDLVELRQDNNTEGTISVSGSTVSYNGFSGQHETSGIAINTEIGTVVSTINELDIYFSGDKKGQTRADHAKVKVSDSDGDNCVYGVVSRFDSDGKAFIASVGIGSVRVTGACAKGDLLESNGDGTAKVQSDDIIRSKTIGKVTIGNSNSGVKLVSCVLYCG